MKVTELKKKYKNKWVLGEVLKEGKYHEVIEVTPLVISDDRDVVYKGLLKVKKGSHVATFFTGQVPRPGMTYTLYVSV